MTKTDYHIFVENGKVGLKDAADRVVLFAVYDGISFTDANTPVCVYRDGKWGLADVRGRIIVDPKYDNIYCPCNDRVAVRIEEKWGYIDYKGKEIIPLIYDDANEFMNAEYCFGTPCAWVQKDGKWGTINTTGEVVIPFEYDSVDDYKGMIIVEKDGKSGIINHKNEFIIPLGDNVINMLDDHIVSFSGDELCGAINLSTNEKYEFDYDIEEYAFSGGYAIIDNANQKNVVDRKFNVLLPEWHDEIVLLDKGKILLIDEDKCVLYDTKSGKSQECHQDDDYVYLPDGKTMYCKSCDDIVHVKAGIENLAYLAHDEEDEKYMAYQKIYDIKTLKFDEGVTTIGTGWEELDLVSSIYEPQVDIYLPSTLKKVNPKAFSKMVTLIRDIYVPFGMGDTMRSILPSHLRPLVKEGTKGITAIFDGVRTKGFSSDPFSLYFQMAMKMPKKLQEYAGVILIILMFIPLWGFALTRDAVLPVDSFSMTVIICIAIISAIISIIVKRKHTKEYKGFFWCMFGWAVVLFAVCGTFLFLFFAANNFIGGGKTKQTYGEIIKLTESGKDTKLDIKIQKFDKVITRSFSTPVPYKEGGNCRVKYHKGLFGIYVIHEDIE